MEIILTLITTTLLSYQVSVGQQHNAKYTFSVDADQSIIVMNTQTGAMHRCTANLQCPTMLTTPVDTLVNTAN